MLMLPSNNKPKCTCTTDLYDGNYNTNLSGTITIRMHIHQLFNSVEPEGFCSTEQFAAATVRLQGNRNLGLKHGLLQYYCSEPSKRARSSKTK